MMLPKLRGGLRWKGGCRVMGGVKGFGVSRLQ